MLRRALELLLLVLGFGVAGYFAAYAAYRARKLNRLKPVRLVKPVEWFGAPDAARKLLLVGDSRIAQWPLAPREGWRVGRLGFPGDTAANIAPSVADQIKSAAAGIVVIQAGGNDAVAAVVQRGDERAATLRHAAEAVIAMGEAARRVGASQIIVFTVVPAIKPELWKRALLGSAPTRLVLEVGEKIAEEARQRGMMILDANRLFRDSHGRLMTEYRTDSTHWSPAAYRLLDRELWSMIMAGGARDGT
jgi:lysophospholipase L1-like esterase